MESEPGKFLPPNVYDRSAQIQKEAGLHVLQVSHIAPPWQKDDVKAISARSARCVSVL
jgi:hypothetical protein